MTRIAALLFVLLALPAAATRIRHRPLEEIRDAATAIVLVDVIDSRTHIGRENMVWTDYRAHIVEVLGGTTANPEITLSFAGGRAGTLDVGIEGVPRLRIGSRYVVFLDDAASRPVPAIGWGDGIFHVSADRIVSLNGEQLILDAHGAMSRRLPAMQDREKLSAPRAFNADGTPALQPISARASNRTEYPAATLNDLRIFVHQRQLQQ